MRPAPELMCVFCLLLACVAAAEEDAVIRLSEPVVATEDFEDFGASMGEVHETMSLSSLLANAAGYENTTVMVEARVSQVCQKKGCFFIARDGDLFVRIAFKDYGFFVPTDIGGRTVTLSGVLVKRELSEAEATHYGEDLGGAAIAAGSVYEIVADAVRVPRKPADG